MIGRVNSRSSADAAIHGPYLSGCSRSSPSRSESPSPPACTPPPAVAAPPSSSSAPPPPWHHQPAGGDEEGENGIEESFCGTCFFTLYQQREEPATPLNRSDCQSEAGTNPSPFCVPVLWTLPGMRNDSPLVCRLRGRGCVGCADGE